MLARGFFDEKEQAQIVNAIKIAESKTSGEIRVHLVNFCFGDELKAAKKAFDKLGMQQTKERNGILIFIAPFNRKIAVVGDIGIHEKLGSEYWNKMIAELIRQFKMNRKAEALSGAIIQCGEQLSKFFPLKQDDKNELSNNLSF